MKKRTIVLIIIAAAIIILIPILCFSFSVSSLNNASKTFYEDLSDRDLIELRIGQSLPYNAEVAEYTEYSDNYTDRNFFYNLFLEPAPLFAAKVNLSASDASALRQAFDKNPDTYNVIDKYPITAEEASWWDIDTSVDPVCSYDAFWSAPYNSKSAFYTYIFFVESQSDVVSIYILSTN